MPTWYQSLAWDALGGSLVPRLMARHGFHSEGSSPLPEGPLLILSNHGNSLDPLAIASISPRPIRFMANLEGVPPLTAAFADLVGAYGRRKGAPDLAALRRTLALASAGESIGLFPEGDRSWDGATQALRPGVGRLAKRLGLPLVLVRQKGNYLARPRWARTWRRGEWSLSWTLFGRDELAALSEGLLDAIVDRALRVDDIKEGLAEARGFEGRGLAEGVERLLWHCPVCGKDDDGEGRGTALHGKDDLILCHRCHSLWRIDANLRISPLNVPRTLLAAPIGDLKDWSDWQRSSLPGLIRGEFPGREGISAAQVTLSRRRGRVLERLGRGSLRLEGGELRFEDGRSRLVFSVPEVRGFVDNFNSFSEFGHRGERWRLEFGEGNSAKWCYALSSGGEVA